MSYSRRGLGETYYKCSNDRNPNQGIYRGSDHSHVKDWATFTAEGGSPANVSMVSCTPDMAPAGAIQGAILTSGSSVTNAITYLAGLPTWALIGGGIAGVFLLSKLFGGGR